MALLGYKKEDVLKMTIMHPAIYTYNINRIIQRIEDLIDLGYTKEQVLEITKYFPAIFGASIENLKEKIKYYDSIGLHEIAVITPKNLMQSIEVSYARYEFYKSIDLDINIDDFTKLFIGRKKFEKQYKVDTTDLLKEYNYNNRGVVKCKSSTI